MKEAQFIQRHRETWRDVEELLEALDADHLAVPVDRFPELYRAVCRHLSIARSRGYSAAVTDRLNPLVERGHGHLYGRRVGDWGRVLAYVRGGFARDVRRDWKVLIVAIAVFFGGGVATFAWVSAEPDWAYHLLGPAMTTDLELTYADPTVGRRSDSDVLMFGFYIHNNVGIALRTFASGIFFGVGSLVILGFNALVLGAAAGHVANQGLGDTFWPFVVGHGAFELTAIAIAGQAGFRLGFAPIWPGRRRRLTALREAAAETAPVVLGMAFMLVIAAFLEAFWSSSAASSVNKYVVGAGLWFAVLLYFSFAGRE